MTTMAAECVGSCACADLLDAVRSILNMRDNGVHYHQCGARAPKYKDGKEKSYPGFNRLNGCGAIWTHRRSDVGNPYEAHQCPDCGKDSRWAYSEADMRAANKKSFDRRLRDGKGLRSKNVTVTDTALFPVPTDGHG